MAINKELRKDSRFKTKTMVNYRFGFFSPVTETVSRDVSVSGICFYSDKKLKVGQKIKGEIFYDPKMPAKKFLGQIAWSKPEENDEDQGYLNGVRFLNKR
jgi:hypothetical protein